MKKTYLIIMLFLLAGFQLRAQDAPRVEEMHARKWQYMVEKAKLSSQEAARVQPIFMEYEQASWRLMEQSKNTFKRFKDARQNNKALNYREMNDQFVNMDLQKAHLFKNYYQKLQKVLSDETLFNYLNAERFFRKELIKDWRNGQPALDPNNRPQR